MENQEVPSASTKRSDHAQLFEGTVLHGIDKSRTCVAVKGRQYTFYKIVGQRNAPIRQPLRDLHSAGHHGIARTIVIWNKKDLGRSSKSSHVKDLPDQPVALGRREIIEAPELGLRKDRLCECSEVRGFKWWARQNSNL